MPACRASASPGRTATCCAAVRLVNAEASLSAPRCAALLAGAVLQAGLPRGYSTAHFIRARTRVLFNYRMRSLRSALHVPRGKCLAYAGMSPDGPGRPRTGRAGRLDHAVSAARVCLMGRWTTARLGRASPR